MGTGYRRFLHLSTFARHCMVLGLWATLFLPRPAPSLHPGYQVSTFSHYLVGLSHPRPLCMSFVAVYSVEAKRKERDQRNMSLHWLRSPTEAETRSVNQS